MITTATGHRPNKLGGYNDDVFLNLVKFAKEQIKANNIEEMNVGMAIGWDMACAQACLELEIPFIGQESRWYDKDKSIYNRLIEAANERIIVSPVFSMKAFHDRNQAMVDDSQAVLALWNGDVSGGTYSCIKYAKECSRPITNIWNAYCQFTSGYWYGPRVKPVQDMQQADIEDIDYRI